MNNELLHWIPEKFITIENVTSIKWLYSGRQPYTDPFFDETIGKCRSLLHNRHTAKSISTIEWLIDYANELDAVDPSAFIFHVSRCGSTLVSQLLGLMCTNIVLAEVPFIDDVLRSDLPQTLKKNLLYAVLKVYGQKRFGNETHLFIKTDSWHLHFIETLRSYFPGVPFFILCREPVGVLQSHLLRKGMQAVPGLLDPALFGLQKNVVSALHPDHYMEKVLEGYYQKVLGNKDVAHTSIVCYEDGILPIVRKICEVTDIHLNNETYESLQQRAKYHSKEPGLHFTGDVLKPAINTNDKGLKELYAAILECR